MSISSPASALGDDMPAKAAPAAPQAGDIVASERSARADVYTVTIVPADSIVIVSTYSAAIDRVAELASTRRVDGWYTSDQTHYARIAKHRSG
jgi:hypothetical protein